MNRAVVKCVLSGDTLVVRGKPVNGPPPEKILTLAGIAAPRLLNRNRGQVEEVRGKNVVCVYDRVLCTPVLAH